MNSKGRLVIVANRLPVNIERTGEGLNVQPSSGGLVSALLPIFKRNGGVWVGWPGIDHEPGVESILRTEYAPDYCLEPVFLTDAEKTFFYDGCCNEILWPLFHDLPSRCNFDPLYWISYTQINEKFADSVEAVAHRTDCIWVHDYHLMMLADRLRARGIGSSLAYFHHIPFPSPDIFEKLPWSKEILRALLQFQLLGFQTKRDQRNFVACVRRCLQGSRVKRIGKKLLVGAGGKYAEVGAFPISIDFTAYANASLSPETIAKSDAIRHSLREKQLLIGVDRLDYTKGIRERLLAFRTLLAREPALRGCVSLIQVIVPSREQIAEYHEYKADVERLVSEINGEYSRPDWSPITYLHRSLEGTELLALYCAADVALVTPLRDGMNLVAKEFCAARCDEQGALVLSEFAGSAAELGAGALLVNPCDVEGMASTLCQALCMTDSEQRIRMRAMRGVIQANDVFKWCKAFFSEATLVRAELAFAEWPPSRYLAAAEAV